MPEGWSLAPQDDDSIAAVAAHGWVTRCLALADGSSWWSATAQYNSPGDSCFSDNLATCEAGRVMAGDSDQVGDSCPAASGPTYTVTDCPTRVLLRCP